ncbi:hypothetical protein QP185_20060 [Sphingomonas aerolata]
MEGHLKQFTAARTVDVPIARKGMYFASFLSRWTGSTMRKG